MIVAGSRSVHPGPVRKIPLGIYLIRTRIHGNCMMIPRKRQAFSRCRRMENLPRGFAPREVALFLDGQRKSCLAHTHTSRKTWQGRKAGVKM